MKLPLIFIFTVIAFTASHAQLGQTEEATATVYGKPLSQRSALGTNLKNLNYRNGSYNIIVGFKDGKAVYVTYKKNTGASWTDDEIKSILDGHRLGNEKWHWTRNIITGHHGPAIHNGPSKHINDAQHWHIFAHDDYAAEYYPEKTLLLIWDASSGVDAASILQQNLF